MNTFLTPLAPPNGSLMPEETQQELMRRMREQAWDEGYTAGKAMKPFDSRTHAKNPYRKAN